MRKPRDYDAELSALTSKAQALRARKVTQLGELVVGCGADALSVDELAGVLLEAAGTKAKERKEAWRVGGAVFFQQTRRGAVRARSDDAGAATRERGAQPRVPGAGEG